MSPETFDELVWNAVTGDGALARDIGPRIRPQVLADQRLANVLADEGRGPFVRQGMVLASLRRLEKAGRVYRRSAYGSRDVVWVAASTEA